MQIKVIGSNRELPSGKHAPILEQPRAVAACGHLNELGLLAAIEKLPKGSQDHLRWRRGRRELVGSEGLPPMLIT